MEEHTCEAKLPHMNRKVARKWGTTGDKVVRGGAIELFLQFIDKDSATDSLIQLFDKDSATDPLIQLFDKDSATDPLIQLFDKDSATDPLIQLFDKDSATDLFFDKACATDLFFLMKTALLIYCTSFSLGRHHSCVAKFCGQHYTEYALTDSAFCVCACGDGGGGGGGCVVRCGDRRGNVAVLHGQM